MANMFENHSVNAERQRIADRHKKRAEQERKDISYENLLSCAQTITIFLQNWIGENQLPAKVESQVAVRDFFESQISLQVNIENGGKLILKLFERGGLHCEVWDQTGSLILKDRSDWQILPRITEKLATDVFPKLQVVLPETQM